MISMLKFELHLRHPGIVEPRMRAGALTVTIRSAKDTKAKVRDSPGVPRWLGRAMVTCRQSRKTQGRNLPLDRTSARTMPLSRGFK